MKRQYVLNPNGIPPSEENIDGLVKTSKLNEIIQGLAVDFVSMGDYFVHKSIEKVITLNIRL